jgi:hypothetical protein
MKLDKQLRTVTLETLRDFNNAECVTIRRQIYEDDAYYKQFEDCKSCPMFNNPSNSDFCSKLITLYDSMNRAFNTQLAEFKQQTKANVKSFGDTVMANPIPTPIVPPELFRNAIIRQANAQRERVLQQLTAQEILNTMRNTLIDPLMNDEQLTQAVRGNVEADFNDEQPMQANNENAPNNE